MLAFTDTIYSHQNALCVIFVSYALHVRFMPFLDPGSQEMAAGDRGVRSALVTSAKLLYVHTGNGAPSCHLLDV
jgi:hypothetical protein